MQTVNPNMASRTPLSICSIIFATIAIC
jgi:hypothetical protein